MERVEAIPLKGGFEAIVSAEDYDRLMQWGWSMHPNGYACRLTHVDEKPARKGMMMHRQIMETPEGLETDHINGNRLDNRRSNLRICTRMQNGANRRKQTSALSSPYKGVYWCNRSKGWMAQIMVGKRNKYIGRFDNIFDAALAYNEKAMALFGEFARLNDVLLPEGFIPVVRKPRSSSYRGVTMHKQSGRWASKIKVEGKYYWLGYFASEREAAERFNEAAIRFGVPHKCNKLS